MKKLFSATLAALACTALVAVTVDAEAKRVGGGRSTGTQRSTANPQTSTPATPAATPNAPAGPTAAAAAPAVPAAGAVPGKPATPGAAAPAAAAGTAGAAAAGAAKTGMSRWLGPIAGIAAGLGLAALMSHLGLSEAFGSLMLMLLVGVAVIALVMFFLRRRAQSQSPSGLQYAGAGAGAAGGGVPLGYETRPAPAGSPLERSGNAFGGATPAPQPAFEPAVAATPAAPASLPPGFDAAGFLQHAKANFNALQAAFDKADLATIRDVTTPEMYEEIKRDLTARGSHRPTEVVRLDASIMEVTTEDSRHWVSVRFTGLTREDGAELATPFDEMWNLSKPVDGSSGWSLAGIQQL